MRHSVAALTLLKSLFHRSQQGEFIKNLGHRSPLWHFPHSFENQVTVTHTRLELCRAGEANANAIPQLDYGETRSSDMTAVALKGSTHLHWHQIAADFVRPSSLEQFGKYHFEEIDYSANLPFGSAKENRSVLRTPGVGDRYSRSV